MIDTLYIASTDWLDLDGSLALQIVAMLALVLVLVISAAKVYDRFWPRPAKDLVPQPLSVRNHDELATRNELMAVEKRIEGDIDEIRQQIEQDRRESRAGIEKTHHRIDEAVSKVDRIGGKLDSLAENVSKLLSLALEQKNRR